LRFGIGRPAVLGSRPVKAKDEAALEIDLLPVALDTPRPEKRRSPIEIARALQREVVKRVFSSVAM